MPLEIKGKVAWAQFGTGDIAFAGMAEENGDRHYLAFQQYTPGAIGFEEDVDRELPIKDGWVPGSGGPCLAVEFANVKSLDLVIVALQDHRVARFPNEDLDAD